MLQLGAVALQRLLDLDAQFVNDAAREDGRPVLRALAVADQDLPVLEDTLLAERVRAVGEWQLLPAEIVTSPRRFQVEGFRERQLLNALLMNFAMIGWSEPLCRVPDAYRTQERARPLQLASYFRRVDHLLDNLSWRERLRLWCRTGDFVRGNAWQIALWRAVRRNADLSVDQATKVITGFRRWFEPLSAHLPGRWLAALLTFCWFSCQKRHDDVIE